MEANGHDGPRHKEPLPPDPERTNCFLEALDAVLEQADRDPSPGEEHEVAAVAERVIRKVKGRLAAMKPPPPVQNGRRHQARFVMAIAATLVLAIGGAFLGGYLGSWRAWSGPGGGATAHSPQAMAPGTDQDASIARQLAVIKSTLDTWAKYQMDEEVLLRLRDARGLSHKGEVEAIAYGWDPGILAVDDALVQRNARYAALLAFRAGAEFLMLENAEMAQRLFQRSQDLRLQSPELDMALANAAAQRKDWRMACRVLEQMLKKPFAEPDRARAANFLAYCLIKCALAAQGKERDDRIRDAEQATHKAFALAGKEDYAKAYVQLALVFALRNDYPQALAALKKADNVARTKLEFFPNSPRLLWTQAIAAARHIQVDKATPQKDLEKVALAAVEKAVAAETDEFPVSYWAPKEDAFIETGLTDSPEFERIMAQGRFSTSFVAKTIHGMLWDEPFEASGDRQTVASPASALSAETPL